MQVLLKGVLCQPQTSRDARVCGHGNVQARCERPQRFITVRTEMCGSKNIINPLPNPSGSLPRWSRSDIVAGVV